jgi:hypothetical protein
MAKNVKNKSGPRITGVPKVDVKDFKNFAAASQSPRPPTH